jgi:hypothetical protein
MISRTITATALVLLLGLGAVARAPRGRVSDLQAWRSAAPRVRRQAPAAAHRP